MIIRANANVGVINEGQLTKSAVVQELDGIVALNQGHGVHDAHAVVQDRSKDRKTPVVLGPVQPGIVRHVEVPLAGGTVWITRHFCHGDRAAQVGNAGLVGHGRVRGDANVVGGLRIGVVEQVRPVSEATIQAVIAYGEYLWNRYGRFPVYMPPYRTVLGFQACHLDAEFYGKFYQPEALSETVRKDFERNTGH